MAGKEKNEESTDNTEKKAPSEDLNAFIKDGLKEAEEAEGEAVTPKDIKADINKWLNEDFD